MSALEQLLLQCENEVRAGAINSVRKKLSGLNTAQVPRALRLPFANLCRRTEMLNVGLKLLSAVVRPDRGRWRGDASPRELAEYAVLLQKSGAVREALWILGQVDANHAPEALVFRAFCHFNKWEYAEAAEALQSYLTLEDRPYQRLIGTVNLASSLVALMRLEEALSLLDATIAEAETGGYNRLKANCLELRAQVHFSRGDLARARADLGTAMGMAGGNSGLDQLLIRKWTAIYAAFEEKSPEKILAMREEAVARQQWETVREADRFALRIQFDTGTFHRLMFGTPFPRYREQIMKESARPLEQNLLLVGAADGLIFDLQTGTFLQEGDAVNPSEKTHQLLHVLLLDFYKPFAAGGLFSELFPGEHFDFDTSMQRVRQVIYRARRWMAESRIPAIIEEHDGKYRLQVKDGIGFLVPYEREPVMTESVRLDILQNRFGDGEFSCSEACSVLGFSPTSFKALMGWALANQRVLRLNGGRSTRYKFAQSPASRAAA